MKFHRHGPLPGLHLFESEMARHLGRHFAGPRGRHRHGHGGFGRSERGSVKYDVLSVLADGPRHGYDIMLAIEERRGFRPSPGSIYPALAMLADGDFVTSVESDGKRIYSITASGRTMLETHLEAGAGTSSDEPGPDAELFIRGMRTLHGLRDAVKQIARSGDTDIMERGVEILSRARRDLYTLLAQEK